jgi:hypothetical protein
MAFGGLLLGPAIASTLTGSLFPRIPHTALLLIGTSVAGALATMINSGGPLHNRPIVVGLIATSMTFQVSILGGIGATVFLGTVRRDWKFYAIATVGLGGSGLVLGPWGTAAPRDARVVIFIVGLLALAGAPPTSICSPGGPDRKELPEGTPPGD